MCNGKCRAPFHQTRNRRLNLLLGRCIQRRCGLIENENPRIVQNCPRDRYPLFFATRQTPAAFPHPHVITIGLFDDKLVCFGCHCGAHHLVKGRVWFAIGDIFGNCAVKQKGLLMYHPDLGSQIAQVHIGHRHAIHQQPPAIGIVEPTHQIDQR